MFILSPYIEGEWENFKESLCMISSKGKATENEILHIFHTFLKEEGLNITSQRDLILRSALSIGGHFTSEDLLHRVKAANPKVGISTIYRTLKLLVKADILEKYQKDGKSIYEVKFGEPHHDHMVCTVCGKYIEFVNEDIEKLQKEVACEYGFKILGHKLQIYGVCSQCQKNPLQDKT